MYSQEIGQRIREARKARKMTQAALAQAAGLSRVTLNQLENGLFPDLGVKKLKKVLDQVGLTLAIQPLSGERKPDFIKMATTSASVSFREKLSEEELIRTLLTGRIAPGRKPHFRAILDEITPTVLRGLIEETGRWAKPGKVRKNLSAIADAAGASKRFESWLTPH